MVQTIFRHGLKNFFNGILIFFFIYNISFTFLPVSTTYLIFYLLFLYHIFKLNVYSKYVYLLKIFIPFLLIIIQYYIITSLNGNNDFSFIYLLSFLMIQCCGGSHLLSVKLGYDYNYVLKLLGCVIFIQSLFIIISFINVPFRSFLDTLLPIDERYVKDKYYFRMRGLSDVAGAALSVIQAFGVLIFMHLSRTSPQKKILYLLLSFIIIISTTVVGRTGMIFSILFVCIYWFGFIFSYGISNLLKVCIFVFCLLFLVYAIVPENVKDIFEQLVLPWMMDKDQSGSSGRTLEILGDMWFWPNGIYFWVGEGGWFFEGATGNYIPSDVGYVRLFYAIGFLGSIIFYSMFGYMFITLKKLFPDKNNRIFFFILFSFLIILETKEPFLMKNSILRLLFLIYFSYRISFLEKRRVTQT